MSTEKSKVLDSIVLPNGDVMSIEDMASSYFSRENPCNINTSYFIDEPEVVEAFIKYARDNFSYINRYYLSCESKNQEPVLSLNLIKKFILFEEDLMNLSNEKGGLNNISSGLLQDGRLLHIANIKGDFFSKVKKHLINYLDDKLEEEKDAIRNVFKKYGQNYVDAYNEQLTNINKMKEYIDKINELNDNDEYEALFDLLHSFDEKMIKVFSSKLIFEDKGVILKTKDNDAEDILRNLYIKDILKDELSDFDSFKQKVKTSKFSKKIVDIFRDLQFDYDKIIKEIERDGINLSKQQKKIINSTCESANIFFSSLPNQIIDKIEEQIFEVMKEQIEEDFSFIPKITSFLEEIFVKHSPLASTIAEIEKTKDFLLNSFGKNGKSFKEITSQNFEFEITSFFKDFLNLDPSLPENKELIDNKVEVFKDTILNGKNIERDSTHFNINRFFVSSNLMKTLGKIRSTSMQYDSMYKGEESFVHLSNDLSLEYEAVQKIIESVESDSKFFIDMVKGKKISIDWDDPSDVEYIESVIGEISNNVNNSKKSGKIICLSDILGETISQSYGEISIYSKDDCKKIRIFDFYNSDTDEYVSYSTLDVIDKDNCGSSNKKLNDLFDKYNIPENERYFMKTLMFSVYDENITMCDHLK